MACSKASKPSRTLSGPPGLRGDGPGDTVGRQQCHECYCGSVPYWLGGAEPAATQPQASYIGFGRQVTWSQTPDHRTKPSAAFTSCHATRGRPATLERFRLFPHHSQLLTDLDRIGRAHLDTANTSAAGDAKPFQLNSLSKPVSAARLSARFGRITTPLSSHRGAFQLLRSRPCI